ncbi:MAG: PKD domain protein [Verrucomicrobia bacterium ADurb.Bin345]|nr:MAG: PKD domain protein [Verrucomicrobia bacterium ADurb.Bin345]
MKTNYITAQAGVSADFTAAPRTGAAPLIVQFTDASTNNPQYWSWDFENDGAVDSTEQDPLHTYTSTGLFTVALTVSNDFGGGNSSSDTIIKTNFISAPAYHLVADFTVSATNARTYEDIEFTDLSQHNPTHWTWYFRNVGTGDSFEQNPTSYYTSAGYKTVKLEISNEWSSAVVVKTNLITVTGHTLTHYVAPGGGNSSPYTNWETAAHAIGDAIDEADVLDTIVVSNGAYGVPFLGLLCNGMVLTSANGAAATIISGGGSENIIRAAAVRSEPTIIDGFTLTNGYTTGDGGGVWITRNVAVQNCVITGCSADEDGGGVLLSYGGVVSNCDIVGNAAGSSGGGVYISDGGTVTHCRVWGNSAGDGGGGIHAYSTNARSAVLISHCVISNNLGCGAYVYRGTIRNSLVTTNRAFTGGGLYLAYSDAENCTVFGNDATHGGGVYMSSVSTARNCIVWGNSRSNLFRNAGVVFEYGNVEPATTGAGNVAGDPRFMNPDGGDFRLKYGSPAIDSGTTDAALADDLDGTARPLDGNYDGSSDFDMGCHEYDPATADSNQDSVPDWWYHGYSLNPTSLTVTTEDDDEDTFNNRAEWIALTHPTDSNSYFFVVDIRRTNSVSVAFNGATQRVYSLQSNTNLSDDSWLMVAGATNRPGAGPATMLIDTDNAIINAYRVQVSLP